MIANYLLDVGYFFKFSNLISGSPRNMLYIFDVLSRISRLLYISNTYFFSSRRKRHVTSRRLTSRDNDTTRRRRRRMVAFGSPSASCPNTRFQFILVFRFPTERAVSCFLPSPRKGLPPFSPKGNEAPSMSNHG